MREQNEIHRMATSLDVGERRIAATTLKVAFLPDKEQATKDLLALTKDVDDMVRGNAILALGSAFPHLTDKQQATKDLLALTKDGDRKIRGAAAYTLLPAFPHLTDKQQATKYLLALIKDEFGDVREFAANTLISAFPHLTDKEQATKDLLALAKDENPNDRGNAAIALGLVFTHLTDKKQATKDLLALTKDEYCDIRARAAHALGSAFLHLTDKEQATKELLALVKDKDRRLRREAAYALSSAARHYIDEKDFKKACMCFSRAASAFKCGPLNIIPEPKFFLYEGFGCYYHGRALVSELPEKDPDEYVKNIKKAVNFFDRSIYYINISGEDDYESETRFFPICLNIYSALYEYNLSYLYFDKKRLANIKKYLDNASAQCKIAGTQRGEDLVRTLEKLTSSLKFRLEEIEQEKKKNKAVENGKGGGWEAKYESHINKLKKDFNDSLIELDETLNELETPLFKKIAAIEKENLEKLQSREPKTSWQRLYEIIICFIKNFWKIIVAIGFILITVAEIITNWQLISEFTKNLLK